MRSIFSLGEALIDFVPLHKGTALKDVSQFIKAPGGAPANVAVAVAKLGGKAAFVGKVGQDAFGDFLVETLASYGVDTDYMQQTAEARTMLAFVSLDEQGNRDFIFYNHPSADELLHPRDIDRLPLTAQDILHIGSISMIQSPIKEATVKAIQLAKEQGSTMSFDPNLRELLWPNLDVARQTILDALPNADIVKVSEEELAFLTSTADETAGANTLLAYGVKLLLVTKGAEGCRYFTEKVQGTVPVPAVEPVDTTGAGDAFMGGFLSQFASQNQCIQAISKDELETWIRFANRCGAAATLKPGAMSSSPHQSELA
ncbi:aminoimidazole riboside kinase [Bacillaceae bacterium SIJ1]|uniref:aminoimidazole riboside kinase n=1 Tax=Litoribacterium kuwaitense TaxID=1398745 RepID=UPI0013EE0F41|nr:aminoimidazole riboside kinase [Litoribacterium kuwaitense]NGP44818.1 aminoimidazole riboside kinase [Litoribacterium kuwaitense]